MAEYILNVYLTKKTKVHCMICDVHITLGKEFVSEKEDKPGFCFNCSPFVDYTFLPSGNVALTRRSKKHSAHCGVVLTWNKRRKRYERRGQYVQEEAIALAKKECAADECKRLEKNKKAALVREVKDKEYVLNFGIAIKQRYPKCPLKREFEIAQHACEKYSGRVGRTAQAKEFDNKMIDLAVEAHIRHTETNYDNEFGKGRLKKEIRADLSPKIKRILQSWR